MSEILPTTKTFALCDRDDKSEQEIREFESAGGIVLPRRHLESHLFDDEVIEALVKREGKIGLLAEARGIVSDALAASIARGFPIDDIKTASRDIYARLKKLLQLRRSGNSADAFMRDTLAPLITPEMSVYAELKSAIVDRVRS